MQWKLGSTFRRISAPLAVGLLLLLAGCNPVRPPAAGLPTVDQPGTTLLAVVADDVISQDLAGESLSSDTLIMTELPVENAQATSSVSLAAVIAPLSSFSTLPPNAAALIDPALLITTTAALGEFHLEQPLTLGEQQVIVLPPTSSDEGNENGVAMTGYYADPANVLDFDFSQAGTAAVAMSFTPFPNGSGPVSDLVDPIQWFCLMCGCCEPGPDTMLRYSSPVDDMILAPTDALPATQITADTWLVAVEGGENPRIRIATAAQYDVLPKDSFALIKREFLPPDVQSAGDIYMSGFDPSYEMPSEFVIERNVDGPTNVTADPVHEQLIFEAPLSSAGAGGDASAAAPSLYAQVDYPAGDFDDVCRIDPWGCLCAQLGLPCEFAPD